MRKKSCENPVAGTRWFSGDELLSGTQRSTRVDEPTQLGKIIAISIVTARSNQELK